MFARLLLALLLPLVLLFAACGGAADGSADGSAADGATDAPAASTDGGGDGAAPAADVAAADGGADAGPCVPACEERTCGPDGCGGSCGTCEDEGVVCFDGACCAPACDGRDCGPDGCGGKCGGCGGAEVCLDGECCAPDCADRQCGPDGCGGSCGVCDEGAVCLDALCCAPACEGRTCGPDGCGGSCGGCAAPRFCVDGACLLPDADDDGIPDVADPFPLDAERPGEARGDVVYAHTATTLYTMDVKTYQIARASVFEGLEGEIEFERRMTDIAIDAYGVLWGVSYLRLYTCHPTTGRCTLMADLDGVVDAAIYEFNALTLVPAALFGELRDVLVGVDNGGGWHRFDVDFAGHTVTTTRLGEYGRGRRSSGDAYSIEGVGTFAAVDEAGDEDDFLIAVDPLTGAAEEGVVATLGGHQRVFGLAGWTQHAFAFDRSGSVLVVDVAAGSISSTLEHRQSGDAVALCELNDNPIGAANPVCTDGTPIEWWGAGVRTRIEE